jgi:HK97 family phage portal protein
MFISSTGVILMANPFKQLIEWLGVEFSENVTPRQAMTLPPMWYGVNKITGHCGRLPLYIKRQIETGGQSRASNHWAYDKLLMQPNGYQTADIFKQQVTGHAILWGNGRAAIVDEEIIPLMPDRTFTMMIGGMKMHVTQPEKDDRFSLYESLIDKKSKTIVFADSEVLHIQGFSFDGIQGLSLVGQMKRALGIPIEQEKHAYNQTKKGFVAKVMVEAPQGTFSKEADAKEWIKQFNEQHSSSENAGKAGLLRNGMTAKVMSMSNSDSEFLEQRRFSRQDIALILGLDGMPGDGDSHSYNSKEMESLNYLDTGLAPWICKWEMQIDTKILTPSERRRGYFSMFELSELLRTDAKTQAEIHSIRISSRIQNPNECREQLGLNPYEGGNEFLNPAITQAPQTTQETDPATRQNTAKTAEKTEKMLVSSLKRLFRREARDVVNGANKKDFCGWLDTYYARWQTKLEEHFEDLELDAELAASHCKESHKMLLDIAGQSTVEQLKANVERCVESWESRAEQIGVCNVEG